MQLIVHLHSIERTDQLLEANSDIFEDMGELRGYEYDFKLQNNYVGKVVPCRSIPFKLIDTYKKELDKMESDKIIAKIEGRPEFVHPVVVVKKPDNSLRICLDPQNLNTYLLRELKAFC